MSDCVAVDANEKDLGQHAMQSSDNTFQKELSPDLSACFLVKVQLPVRLIALCSPIEPVHGHFFLLKMEAAIHCGVWGTGWR